MKILPGFCDVLACSRLAELAYLRRWGGARCNWARGGCRWACLWCSWNNNICQLVDLQAVDQSEGIRVLGWVLRNILVTGLVINRIVARSLLPDLLLASPVSAEGSVNHGLVVLEVAVNSPFPCAVVKTGSPHLEGSGFSAEMSLGALPALKFQTLITSLLHSMAKTPPPIALSADP